MEERTYKGMKSLFLYMGVERVRTAYMSLQWERQIKERIGYIQLVNCLPIETLNGMLHFLYRRRTHQNGLYWLAMERWSVAGVDGFGRSIEGIKKAVVHSKLLIESYSPGAFNPFLQN